MRQPGKRGLLRLHPPQPEPVWLRRGGVQQNRGVKHGTQESASSSYYVLRKTKMPGVLIELGFIDNQKDNQLLDKHKKAYAKAIAKGIIQTYEKYHGEQANSAKDNTKSK